MGQKPETNSTSRGNSSKRSLTASCGWAKPQLLTTRCSRKPLSQADGFLQFFYIFDQKVKPPLTGLACLLHPSYYTFLTTPFFLHPRNLSRTWRGSVASDWLPLLQAAQIPQMFFLWSLDISRQCDLIYTFYHPVARDDKTEGVEATPKAPGMSYLMESCGGL